MISVCMIVRDEADCIARALQTVAPDAEEICIVDTGSVDDTVEIARSFGEKIKIQQVVWEDDFAKARNVSLEMATEDWILILDADEWLLPGHVIWLKHYIATLQESSPQTGAYQPLVLSPTTTGVDLSQQIRVFRNHQGTRYVGRSHSGLDFTPCGAPVGVVSIPVTIVHEGYMPYHMEPKAKLERNVRIQEKEHSEMGDNPYTLFNLGRTYFQLGRFGQANECLRKCQALKPEITAYDERLKLYLEDLDKQGFSRT